MPENPVSSRSSLSERRIRADGRRRPGVGALSRRCRAGGCRLTHGRVSHKRRPGASRTHHNRDTHRCGAETTTACPTNGDLVRRGPTTTGTRTDTARRPPPRVPQTATWCDAGPPQPGHAPMRRGDHHRVSHKRRPGATRAHHNRDTCRRGRGPRRTRVVAAPQGRVRGRDRPPTRGRSRVLCRRRRRDRAPDEEHAWRPTPRVSGRRMSSQPLPSTMRRIFSRRAWTSRSAPWLVGS